MKLSKRKLFKIVWFTFVIGFMSWQWWGFQSHNLPEDTFRSDKNIQVTITDDEFRFKPVENPKSLEVIYFQGGLTDPKAYGPLCRELAKDGYIVHLIRADFRLPVHDYNKITTLFDLQNGNYVIGGHSQGAKMAAQFVYENPGLMRGLFIMGTSHPRDFSLSGRRLPILKIYAEHDGLASVAEVEQNKAMLPSHTDYRLILGGNHSQFGYLGHLFMDDDATISLENQQQQTMKLVIEFLNSLE